MQFGGVKQFSKLKDFLPTLNSIFSKARYFGIAGYGFTLSFCWTFILFLMLLAFEACSIWKLIRLLAGWATNLSGGRGIVARVSGSMFYGNALLSLILSSKFVHSWESLSSFWLSTETSEALTFAPDVRIRKRAIFVTSLVATFAFVEHMLSMMSATGFDCPPEEYFERYILSSHGFVLQAHEYNLWVAIPIFILSKLATALWNFQDLIIILISMGLTSRYHRLNLYVHHVVRIEKRYRYTQKVGTELYLRIQKWRRLREAYVRHATLVRMVDRKLGALVLLSNINNLYFICLQLFLGMHKDKGSAINRGYYFLSLGWLLFRACSVVLAAADVHLHSQRALKALYSCPSAAYNVEIKRLQYQLTHDYVALSGMGFFSLRRELLLEVAAAIIKYELVLIQYDS
ncbi:gustatory receptor for sugar taste 64a-like [Anticarsia gemmatalis]|uniref:gustatory receptor for sugar taste 64a-like n=1 Tax=Anticarsia gemmatalis TaxID=129554 RepID=UPI003F76E20C